MLSSYMRFFWAGLCKHGQTGGLFPSQRFLTDAMIAPVPKDYSGEVVELGPGNGALTLRLAALRPRVQVLACEINPDLAEVLEKRVHRAGFAKRVQVINDSAEHLLAARAQNSRVSYIISGIPLGNLGKEPATRLIRAIHSGLVSGGLYIQFQHSLLDRKKIQGIFSRLQVSPVWLNFPPAVVYRATK